MKSLNPAGISLLPAHFISACLCSALSNAADVENLEITGRSLAQLEALAR